MEDKDKKKKSDRLSKRPEQPGQETIEFATENRSESTAADVVSKWVGRIAAIYHGETEQSAPVEEESLLPEAEQASEAAPVLSASEAGYPDEAEIASGLKTDGHQAASGTNPSDVPHVLDKIDSHSYVDLSQESGETLYPPEEKMSRREVRKKREDEQLYLSAEEARKQISRQLRPKNTEAAALSFVGSEQRAELRKRLAPRRRPQQDASRRNGFKVAAILVFSTVIIVAAAFFVSRMNRPDAQVADGGLSFGQALAGLDYMDANRLYIINTPDDASYHEDALASIRDHELDILAQYRNGHITIDSAYDQLTALAYFMPLWPAEDRTVENALSLSSESSPIVPEVVLAESFTQLSSYQEQERNFRIGQQLLNMDMNAAAIPYLRQVVNSGGQLSETASGYLRRSESAYLVSAMSEAQRYVSSGDELRARLILESASTLLEDNDEISSMLNQLPPMNEHELLLDITAMAMTYFDAERYHESLLIIDVGRNFLTDLVSQIESGANLSTLAVQISNDIVDYILVNSGEQALRQTLADSLRDDIDSLNEFEEQLRESIVTELSAKAEQLADQGKYREARDAIDLALEFNPDDETLISLRQNYHNMTRLRLNNFISSTTVSGFSVQTFDAATDIGGDVHEQVTRIGSTLYTPALTFRSLPHRHNSFQGVFFLSDPGEAENVQVVISQGSRELFRSSPMNARNKEASFNFTYDFRTEMKIDILGSSNGSATRYQPMAGIDVLLEAYFYNDGSWDESIATSLHAEYVNRQSEEARILEQQLADSLKIDLYDEILDDSIWNQIFGHNSLLDEAVDSEGQTLTKLLKIQGRENIQVQTDANYIRGRMYFEEGSRMADGVVLMVENESGNRFFSQIANEANPVAEFQAPLSGQFNLLLLNAAGERLQSNQYQVIIKGQLYDFDQPHNPDSPDVLGSGSFSGFDDQVNPTNSNSDGGRDD